MLDFSNNVNFLGPPNNIKRALRDGSDLYTAYPDYQHKDAKQAIADHFALNSDSIAIGIGSTELFSIIPKLVGSDAIGIAPSFWEYRHFFKKTHPEKEYNAIILPASNDFELSTQEFINALALSAAKLCYIANPNNPTATKFTREQLISIIEYFPDKLFVIDETYLPFTEGYMQDSLFCYAQEKRNLIVAASISKIFALPGLRIGYCCSHPDNIHKICDHVVSYGMNPLSLKIIPQLLKQPEYLQHTQQQYKKNRAYMQKCLQDAFADKIKIYNSQTAFMLIKFANKMVTSSIEPLLLEKGIKVRCGSEFAELGIEWMRLSIRDAHAINKLVKALLQAILHNK